jgi:hypothetical protein
VKGNTGHPSWQDLNSGGYSDDSRNFMGALISGGTYIVGGGRGDAIPVPTFSTLGLLLLITAMVYFTRRRIRA